MKDDVKFYLHGKDKEIVAVFPNLVWNRDGDLTCYVHNGQHGAITKGFIKSLRLAKPSEYEDLQKELTDMVGYDLNILNTNYKRLIY